MGFYWTLKQLQGVGNSVELYVVDTGVQGLLCSGLCYRALVLRADSRLKKKSQACRYWIGWGCSLVVLKDIDMSKRELIDSICEINRGAKPEFLASFSEEELNTYLEHLMELDVEVLAVSC